MVSSKKNVNGGRASNRSADGHDARLFYRRDLGKQGAVVRGVERRKCGAGSQCQRRMKSRICG
jgi:hypothetical protein